MFRSWRIHLAVTLILGLLTAWAVAWLAFALPDTPAAKGRFSIGRLDFGSELAKRGHNNYWMSPALDDSQTWEGKGVPKNGFGHPRRPGLRGSIVRTAGWPLRSAIAGRDLFENETFDDWGMIRFGGPRSIAFPFDTSFPIRPLWLGLAGNAGMCVTAWWLLLGGPVVVTMHIVRSRRVKKKGHCPACGYDLTGAGAPVCPECGTAFAPPAGKDGTPAPIA